MNRMADDVHLLAGPVRIAADWIKILVFIAVLPIVFIVSLVNWILTGKPIMSPDEIWLTKVLLTVLSPWITTLTYIFCKHVREMRGHECRSPVPNFVVFFATILIVLFLVKCNFLFGWSFYNAE